MTLNLNAAKDRITEHADSLGVEAPRLLDEDSAPSVELCAYCHQHDLSLDWIFGLSERMHAHERS